MFSPKITSTDAFLDMPVSSRELYFQLWMNADDDGFITPKRMMRMLWCPDDDLKTLIYKWFVIPFDSGVIVISARKVNNLVRKDRYQETIYKEEKALLSTKESWEYELVNEMSPESLTNRSRRLGKVSIGKDSIDNNSIIYKEEEKIYFFVNEFLDLENPQIKYQISKNKDYIESQYKYIDLLIKDWYTLESIQTVLAYIKQDEFRSKNILSIKKLREKDKNWVPYIVRMIEKIKQRKPKAVDLSHYDI